MSALSGLLLFATLATSTPPASSPTTTTATATTPQPSSSEGLLLLDLKAVGIEAAQAQVADGLLATVVTRRLGQLEEAHRPVLHTRAELVALSTVEAERMLTGCDADGSACFAEIANAVGARYVIGGSLGRLGDDVVVALSLIDTDTARTLSRVQATRPSSQVNGALVAAVDELLVPFDPPTRGVSPLVVGGGVAAGLGVVAGVLGFGAAGLFEGRLAPTSTATGDQKVQALALGPPALIVGGVGALLVVGGVTAVAIGLASGE
ncbi:MAG TPA: hypothetical protein VGF99_01085 [Myxococcota bacterium]